MKERPIIFSGEMVRAILDGRKTQTRRVIKPQPYWIKSSGRWCWDLPRREQPPKFVCTGSREWYEYLPSGWSPTASVGDRLWARETWAHYQTVEYAKKSDGRAFDEISDGAAWYRADGIDTIDELKDHMRLVHGLEAVVSGDRWKPSIHMPRWASRITLEVTGVRVERVQEISEEDVESEGLQHHSTAGDSKFWANKNNQFCTAREAFREAWDAINTKRGFSWESNPWVWVVEFQVLRALHDEEIEV